MIFNRVSIETRLKSWATCLAKHRQQSNLSVQSTAEPYHKGCLYLKAALPAKVTLQTTMYLEDSQKRSVCHVCLKFHLFRQRQGRPPQDAHMHLTAQQCCIVGASHFGTAGETALGFC